MEFNLNQKATHERLTEFAEKIQQLQQKIGFPLSARGWCYQLEEERLINKNEFGKVEGWINKCRKLGILPIDFTAEEEGRRFSGVEIPNTETPVELMGKYVDAAINIEDYYTPDWWYGEEYYIQMLVEKIDLKTLFTPVCEKYHIPIATSKGWSSMLQRAIYARRFKEAEDRGLNSVLLYCGDHDPDGLRISEFIRKNLEDLAHISWKDGMVGYNPAELEIVRFGLNYDFIDRHHLTWIDNLITGNQTRTMDLADESHKNHNMSYVREYIEKYGVRKCEANALVPKPEIAMGLVEGSITHFLGEDAENRFKTQRKKVKREVDKFRKKSGVDKQLEVALKVIKNEQKRRFKYGQK